MRKAKRNDHSSDEPKWTSMESLLSTVCVMGNCCGVAMGMDEKTSKDTALRVFEAFCDELESCQKEWLQTIKEKRGNHA